MASPLRNQPEPEDQRNVIIATVLVAAILFGWMFWFSPQQSSQQQAGAPSDTAQTPVATDPAAAPADTPSTSEGTPDDGDQSPPRVQATGPDAPGSDSITAAALQGTARQIVVETDFYTAVLSSKGATLKRFTLKQFTQFNQVDPVQIVDTTAGGTLSLSFRTPSGKRVDTRSLFFNSEIEGDTIRVEDEPRSITFATALGDGELHQTYTFHPDDYDLGLSVRQKNPAGFITASGYELAWHGGMPYSEGGQEQELTFTGLYAWSGGEVESVTLSDGDHGEKRLNGSISWLAVKNKYFTAALMPDAPNAVRGATLVGDKVDQASTEAAYKRLNGSLRMPRGETTDHVDEFHLYAGPVDYYALASYERDLYAMVDYGWDWFEWITKPLAKYLYIPMLTYLGQEMPDWMGGGLPYGVTVILMAIFIKTLVYPLTKSSYRSMAQMRELQPKMEELREKYDDDPQKQQEETMNLYRETGVNPLGGCLPMFLQYPILISLYQFIPKSIQLRQESFLWASDLSAPDKILQLPVDIPFYGDYVAGFTLLMGLAMVVTMRVQSTASAGGGGQMKALMYAMPAVIFFIFNRFASALSLYYLFYNIMTAAQQKWINMQLEKEKDEDGNLTNGQSDADGSDGFFARVMDRARKAQEQQQKSS